MVVIFLKISEGNCSSVFNFRLPRLHDWCDLCCSLFCVLLFCARPCVLCMCSNLKLFAVSEFVAGHRRSFFYVLLIKLTRALCARNF